jgi:hypothetical protein
LEADADVVAAGVGEALDAAFDLERSLANLDGVFAQLDSL